MSVFVLFGVLMPMVLGNEVDILFGRLQERHNISQEQLSHFIVVGNGPLADGEREEINSHGDDAVVLRFNDENNYVAGDRVHVHAIRHPSWMGRVNGLEEWHIAALSAWIPKTSNVHSIVYEHQYENENEAASSDRLFPSTCMDATCWINQTKYGASTGGIVLSKLNEHTTVKNISVFAMNWGGSSDHVDFKHPKLVSDLCTKCNIHHTHSNNYGQSGTITALVVLATISVLGCLVFVWIADVEAIWLYRYMYRNALPETKQLQEGSVKVNEEVSVVKGVEANLPRLPG